MHAGSLRSFMLSHYSDVLFVSLAALVSRILRQVVDYTCHTRINNKKRGNGGVGVHKHRHCHFPRSYLTLFKRYFYIYHEEYICSLGSVLNKLNGLLCRSDIWSSPSRLVFLDLTPPEQNLIFA